MNTPKIYVLGVVALLMSLPTFGQEDPYANQYNESSVRPIRRDDQMFRKSLWWRMDLRTRQNEPFFAQNNELSRILIDAVREGRIEPFQNDSLTRRMSIDEFNEKLRIPQAVLDLEHDLLENDDDGWEDTLGKGKKANEPVNNEYFPRQLYIFELKEDLIFDNRRSRMYNDLLAITMMLPAEQNAIGVEKVICSFSYRELVEKVFKHNPKAIWFNPQNGAQHRNLSDAFDLRLHGKYLVKYENPRDGYIVDMYGNNKRALQMSEQTVFKLMEYEATLWSY